MKTIKTIILSFACLAMASCDFLDKEPTKLTPDNYFIKYCVVMFFLSILYIPDIYPPTKITPGRDSHIEINT